MKDKIFVSLFVVLTLIVMPIDGSLVRVIRDVKAAGGIVTDIFALFIPLATFFGHGATIAMLGLCLFIAGRISKRLHIVFVGKMILICYIFSGITVQVLKHLLGRARPRLTDEIVFIGPSWLSGYDSFPSGHTAVVFCLAYVFSSYFKKYSVLFYALSSIAAIERFYNLSHFPSDVLAGISTGMIVGMFIVHFNRDGRLATRPID
ncbi:MAG: phosphatase PAP2 family protein [Thermodesulfovibrionales bacterium]